MSEDFQVFGDGTDGDDPGRGPVSDGRRAMYAVLSVLGFMVLVVAIGVILLRSKQPTSSGSDNIAGPLQTASESATKVTLRTVDVFPTGTHHHAAISIARKPSTTASSAASTTPGVTPTRTPTFGGGGHPTTSHTTPHSFGPCSSAAPCAIGGDGGAIVEVQRLRDDFVPGFITSRAQQCALSVASGGGCVGAYASQVEFSEDGRAAADATFADPTTWLREPGLRQFQVGWAYSPLTGRYYCGFVKN